MCSRAPLRVVVLAVSAIVGLCSLPPSAASQVVFDDFDDNTINSAHWAPVQTGVGPTIAEVNNRLEISFTPDSRQEAGQIAFSAGVISTCRLRGDFDIQADYALLLWPASNGVRVGLLGAGAVERTSLGNPADFPSVGVSTGAHTR